MAEDDDDDLMNEMPPTLTAMDLYEDDEPSEDTMPDMPELDDFSQMVENQREIELARKLTYDFFHYQAEIEVTSLDVPPLRVNPKKKKLEM